MTKQVAVLGSGQVGEVLANGFLKHGYSVMRGTREPAKLDAWKQGAQGNAQVGTFVDSAKWGELVVIAVKGSAAESLVSDIAPHISGKTVIDTTNPIADGPPQNGVIRYFTSGDDSLLERLQKKVPAAKLVKAFNSVGSGFMVNPKFPLTPTMFICGNDGGAKQQVSEVLVKFGWEAADMGPVEAARPIEALCQLWCLPGFLRNDWAHAFKLMYPSA
jgi:predicted dinucleotide-binding enzyme